LSFFHLIKFRYLRFQHTLLYAPTAKLSQANHSFAPNKG
jgi:hypothetical protein